MNGNLMMKLNPIHPFPARMAPEIAISELGNLASSSVVLDPMMGSGTVLRHAVAFGHKALGFDMDPLAVLMSRVWSTSVEASSIDFVSGVMNDVLPGLRENQCSLPWIDDDEETGDFVKFWFGLKQRRDLRRLAFAIDALSQQVAPQFSSAVDVLRIALSKIIITKSSGASLAWDVSHSRPHKVMESSEFEVIYAFEKSLKVLRERLSLIPRGSRLRVKQGDARQMPGLRKETVDMVLTSPPYLNAIDYMRGHKLSLVWLGHTISSLRAIRAQSVGAERRADKGISDSSTSVQRAMVDRVCLSERHLSMVERYSVDLVRSLHQSARVLKPGGKAIYVVGNSCLKETFIRNSDGVIAAASCAGLLLVSERMRHLPSGSRYLPMPKDNDSALGKRMRTESILTFKKVA